jgi:hypothetical protein
MTLLRDGYPPPFKVEKGDAAKTQSKSSNPKPKKKGICQPNKKVAAYKNKRGE